MGIKDEATMLALKKKELEKLLLDSELAAIRTLKSLAQDKAVDAGVRLSASHILLKVRDGLQQDETDTTS
jgi:hypothetical protein